MNTDSTPGFGNAPVADAPPAVPTANMAPPEAAPNPQEGDPAVYTSLPIIVIGTPDAGGEMGMGGEENALSGFPFPTLPLHIATIQQFDKDCVNAGVTYGLGAKVPFHGAKPGHDFSRVDCSGFVREALWRASTPHAIVPDGSVVQHEWANNQGFKKSSPEAGALSDGAIRIAFLSPGDTPEGIGHVVLLYGGRTYESYGHHGPGSRDWASLPWHSRTTVYVLAAPTA